MFYRPKNVGKFIYFEVKHKDSNLLCGLKKSYRETSFIEAEIRKRVEKLYRILEKHEFRNPGFFDSLEPMEGSEVSGEIVKKLCSVSLAAGVGPMASIAGAFSDEVLDIILSHSEGGFVENGGDIAVSSKEDINIGVFPGWGQDKASIAFRLPPGRYGIASSSGKYGPSFSMGEGDMVSVISETATMADGFATSICNKIKDGADVKGIVESFPQLKGVSVMWKGKIWYKGDFELTFLDCV